jgi:putative ABC transport system permease protein
MKYLGYVLRNVRRNIVRTILTIGSISVSLFLMMIMLSFLSVNDTVSESLKTSNRIIAMSSQGFAAKVPIRFVEEVGGMDGVVAASPLSWFGGKYQEENMPFAQFGIYPDQIFKIWDELEIPEDQKKAFVDDPSGCVIGFKMADERKIKIGDPMPLKGTIYPFDMNLTVRGIYKCAPDRDGRMLIFNWNYLEEGLKQVNQERYAGNAGTVFLKIKPDTDSAAMCRIIDAATLNSDTPTRSQTEDAFVAQFAEIWGDMKLMISAVGLAVVVSLIFVSGNAMAMAMRERTTEIAVLKAIGFTNGKVLGMVLTEAVLVSTLGGVVGALGSKLLFDVFDISPYTAGALPFFFIPWPTALLGLGASIVIGFTSGLFPALAAARLGVIQGLRKVV